MRSVFVFRAIATKYCNARSRSACDCFVSYCVDGKCLESKWRGWRGNEIFKELL